MLEYWVVWCEEFIVYVNIIYLRVFNKLVFNGLDKSINVFINFCKV